MRPASEFSNKGAHRRGGRRIRNLTALPACLAADTFDWHAQKIFRLRVGAQVGRKAVSRPSFQLPECQLGDCSSQHAGGGALALILEHGCNFAGDAIDLRTVGEANQKLILAFQLFRIT